MKTLTELALRAKAAHRFEAALEIEPEVSSESPGWTAESFRTRFTAALLRSNEPNLNSAILLDEDVEQLVDQCAETPVNINHNVPDVTGVVTAGRLEPVQGETPTPGQVLRIDGVLWDTVRPDDVVDTRFAWEDGWARVSFEIVPNRVVDQETGESYSYWQWAAGDIPSDLATGRHVRRLAEPVLTGVGIILPPNRPGWPEAILDITQH